MYHIRPTETEDFWQLAIIPEKRYFLHFQNDLF